MKRKLLSCLALLSVACSPTTINAEQTSWRQVSPDNLMVMTLPHGKVIFELTPMFTPNHVDHFKKLAAKGHYQNNKFYRVIDGFVAQAGPGGSEAASANEQKLAIEEEWPSQQTPAFTLVQNQDLFAEQTGFYQGFALGRDNKEDKTWFTHCPGVLAMARGNGKDTATSHFYITNGQAPRYLDRIMTVFGRVVYGMNHVQAITRTQVMEGEAPVASENYTPIINMQLMSSLPANEQWQIAVEDTESEAFATRIEKRRKRNNAFFYKKPPPVLDVCQMPVRAKVVKPAATSAS